MKYVFDIMLANKILQHNTCSYLRAKKSIQLFYKTCFLAHKFGCRFDWAAM